MIKKREGRDGVKTGSVMPYSSVTSRFRQRKAIKNKFYSP